MSTEWEEQSLAQCPLPLEEGDFWQQEKHSTALAVANAGQWQVEEPWGWCLAATRAIQRLYMHGCSPNEQEQLRRTDVLKIRAFLPN